MAASSRTWNKPSFNFFVPKNLDPNPGSHRGLFLICQTLDVGMSRTEEAESEKALTRITIYLNYSSISQCCGSGMFIPDPDFHPSRIPDPGSKNRNKMEG
jgi:hypothetical protein